MKLGGWRALRFVSERTAASFVKFSFRFVKVIFNLDFTWILYIDSLADSFDPSRYDVHRQI